MAPRSDLGDFLALRRAHVRPEEVGLPDGYGRRRVPGLRREELSLLAGVSPSYYTRLEQGQSLNASREVLDAIARALQLDEDEHAHLHNLARGARAVPLAEQPAVEHAASSTRDLVRALADVPAVVTGRRGDVLLWNDAWHALFAGHLDPTSPERPADRPNTARLVFLDPHTRELYADWETKARGVVEHLRLLAGRHPEDPLLAGLIGELTMKSSDFAALWADHGVAACGLAAYEVRHPLVGRLEIAQQTMLLVGVPDQSLITVTCEPGSSTEAGLLLLRRARAAAGGHSAPVRQGS
jgi:transcriptional regulator with XRE-family HTH domain